MGVGWERARFRRLACVFPKPQIRPIPPQIHDLMSLPTPPTPPPQFSFMGSPSLPRRLQTGGLYALLRHPQARRRAARRGPCLTELPCWPTCCPCSATRPLAPRRRWATSCSSLASQRRVARWSPQPCLPSPLPSTAPRRVPRLACVSACCSALPGSLPGAVPCLAPRRTAVGCAPCHTPMASMAVRHLHPPPTHTRIVWPHVCR